MKTNRLGLRKTKSLTLASRLFISHLIVTIVGIVSLIIIGKVSSPRFFVVHLEELEGRGFSLRFARNELVRGFETAWYRGTIWSLSIGASTAGVLSYWVSKRIVQRIIEMEQITQKFATGKLDARLPNSDIPELDRLSVSFNRMAASLEGVEQRRRELVSDLTHELRTPLTVMRGYLEELSSGELESSPEIYQRLAKETKRLERLVNDLQELSKAEAGYLPIYLQPIDLRPLLESLVARFGDQILEEGPTLYLESLPQLPLVKADLDRTEQILVNLIGNAIRYTPSGTITIRTEIESDKLWIAVIDTGIGIAPEDLPYIFDRFFRTDRSRTRNSGGTGIGLAITRRLVELQAGQIEVASQLNRGSIFRFCLPLA